MAKFKDSVVTNLGLKVLAGMLNGDLKVNYQHVYTATQDLTGMTADDIKGLTTLTEIKQTIVASKTAIDDAKYQVNLGAEFTNKGVPEDYNIMSIGWTCLDATGQEILFAVTPLVSAEIMPADDGTGNSFFTIYPQLTVAVSDTGKVSATIKEGGTITQAQLDAGLATKADDTTVAQLRTDVDGIDIGGVNLIEGTSRNGLNVLVPDKHAEFLTKGLVDESLPHSQYYLCRIWFQLPDVDMYVGLHLAGNGGTETVTGSVVKAGTSGYSQIQVKMKDGQYPYESFVQTVGDVGGFYLTYKRYSVEAGTKFTDWSPAPDEMASKDDVTTGMNQANAYTDAGLKPKADDAKVIHNDSGYGAENLIMNSGYPTGTEGWKASGAGLTNKNSSFSVGTLGFYHNSVDTLFRIFNASLTDNVIVDGNTFQVTPGETLIWQIKGFAGSNSSGALIGIWFGVENVPGAIMDGEFFSPNKIEEFSCTTVVPAGVTQAHFTVNAKPTTTANSAALVGFTEVKVARELQLSPWSAGTFAGRITGTISTTQQFYRYSSTARDAAITWNKIGNLVTLNGAVTPVATLPGSSNPVCIAKWPTELGAPYPNTFFICQGTDTAIWQLEIATDGSINFSRYRKNDGTGTFTACPTGTWLPFSPTFVVH